MRMISLPAQIEYILKTLQDHGYSAYIVGGCVRDSLLGLSPQDWDVCTAALPEQVKVCFAGHRIIETGLRHGTVTLILNHQPSHIEQYIPRRLLNTSFHK